MALNILEEFIGINISEAKGIVEENKEKNFQIAAAIVKLSEYPEFKVLEEELERLKNNIDLPSEAYVQDPGLARYHSGMKRSIVMIQNFLKSQINILELYGKEQKASGKES